MKGVGKKSYLHDKRHALIEKGLLERFVFTYCFLAITTLLHRSYSSLCAGALPVVRSSSLVLVGIQGVYAIKYHRVLHSLGHHVLCTMNVRVSCGLIPCL